MGGDIGQHESEDNSDGSYKVREVLSDDLNDMVIDDVKAVEKNKVGEMLKKELKKNIKKQMIQTFKGLESELAKT